jgi:HSP20 family protein
MTSLASRSSQESMTPARRWNPSREMEDIQDRFGQLIQSVFGSPETSRWAVPVDIEETDDAYIVEIDLPNVRPEDVNVELRDNELWVSGEYRRRERSGILRRQTRRIGEFEYVVSLPGDVDRERVEARLADGVLTVNVGKAASSRPRRISVNSS